MPELPELEALARRIAAPLSAAPIARTPDAHFAIVKTAVPPLTGLTGHSFTGVRRRGKHLLFDVDDGTTLAVHLMTMGRIGYHPPGTKRPRGGVLAVELADGGALIGTEAGTRKSMRVGLYTAEGLEGLLGHLGPEPLEPSFDVASLSTILGRDSRRLNALLRDGRVVAGIGRAFADEILHAARLSPFALSNRLEPPQVESLHAAIQAVLRAATATCAAVDGMRLPQKNDARPLAIHGRAGEPCPRCASPLRFVDFESNRIVYCPACQTGGRVLADRRMSRLLK